MKEQGQIDEMRAAIRGDRERALARLRAEGREPLFPDLPPEPPPPPAPPPAAEPAADPEPAPRLGYAARLFGRIRSPRSRR